MADSGEHIPEEETAPEVVPKAKASSIVAAKAAAAAPKAKAAAAQPSPKRRGRTRNADRPRIDIDDEIEAANKLAAMMKKLAHAAKMAERNSQRTKARLVKKCGKLSAQDMERLAILKRCGLMGAEEEKDDSAACAASSSSSKSSASASSSAENKKAKSMVVLQKLASAVSKHGSEDALDLVQQFADLMDKDEAEASPVKKKRRRSRKRRRFR